MKIVLFIKNTSSFLGRYFEILDFKDRLVKMAIDYVVSFHQVIFVRCLFS